MKSIEFSTFLGHRVTTHVWKFMQTNSLVNPDGEYLIALSGGIDSVFLLHLFIRLKHLELIKDVQAIHIHHATRDTQDGEEIFVKELCTDLGVTLNIAKLAWDDKTFSNFEHKARHKRYREFFSELTNKQFLVLGHHIDDSFEWSLLQSLKSSHLNSQLGIPVRNDRIIRPFMCMTKKQLTSIATDEKINYIEDPTNEHLAFERNYLRHEVIRPIELRHKKYLKNYVHKSNELARTLGLHIKAISKDYVLNRADDHSWILINTRYDNEFETLKSIIRQTIHKLSSSGRGSLSSQIDALVRACKNNKSGPLLFSGRVNAYADRNFILFSSHKLETKKVIIKTKNYKYMSLKDFEVEAKKYYSKHKNKYPMLVAIKKESFFGSDLVSKKNIGHFYNIENNHSNVVVDSVNGLLSKWKHKKGLRDRKLAVRVFE
jgi:tRNA(Ile)-lysidine synthase